MISFFKRTAALIHPFHDHKNHTPHFVAIIPLTHKTVFFILPPRKRKFLSKGGYLKKIRAFFDERPFSLTLYDLYYLLKNFAVNETYGTINLFFDSLKSEKAPNCSTGTTEYPFFFLEINFDSGKSRHYQAEYSQRLHPD